MFRKKIYMALGLSLIILMAIVYHREYIEQFTRDVERYERERPIIFGTQKVSSQGNLVFRLPNLAVPLKKQITYYIANVPLTPFTAPLVTIPIPSTGVPKFLMYRKLTPIRGQGVCGSCWAFSVCDMLADRLMIQSGGAFNQELSVQTLISCFNRNGCDGGSPEDACLWMASSGKTVESENVFPYKQFNGGAVPVCPIPQGNVQVGIQNGQVYSIVKFVEEKNPDPLVVAQNVQNMKMELLTRGPFYCAITVYDGMYSFSGLSVYSEASGSVVGGHAVLVIGYCDAGVDPRRGFDKAYWICQNSWGKNWPLQSESGMFAIEAGRNFCGVESRCGFATPELVSSTIGEVGNLPISDLRYENIQDYLKQ